MSFELDVKLLLMLTIFSLEDVFGRGKGLLPRPAALSVEGDIQGRSFMHDEERSSGLFNVKSFGARADGRTDDSHVSTYFYSFLFFLNISSLRLLFV